MKVAYRCLWPSCGKVLTSVVGIKKHIRTTHLQRWVSLSCTINRATVPSVASTIKCNLFTMLKHYLIKQYISSTGDMLTCAHSGGSEHECCSHSEEDFYYTEIRQWEEPQRQSPPPLCDPAPSSPTHSLSPRRPTSPSSAALSSSAPSLPSSLWQVQVEHSYQVHPFHLYFNSNLLIIHLI